MKTVGCGIVFAVVLATAPVALVNAQDATQPPATPDLVTRQELNKDLQGQQEKTNRAINAAERRANDRMDGLIATEKKDAQAASDTMAAQRGQIDANVRANTSALQYIKGLRARGFGQFVWLTVLSGVVIFVIVAGAFFVRRILRGLSARDVIIVDPTMDDLTAKLSKVCERVRGRRNRTEGFLRDPL